MRVRNLLVMGSLSLCLGGVFAAGCGGSSESSPAQDAGNDTTSDVGSDQSVADTSTSDVKEGGNACVEDASLTQLNLPDASIADGGSSVGLCMGCIKANCDAELTACAADCPCNNAVETVLSCVLTRGFNQACLGPVLTLTGNSQQLGLGLGQCLLGSCQNACAPGLDAGTGDSGGDAISDSPSDG
jgi:hypothetical protein